MGPRPPDCSALAAEGVERSASSSVGTERAFSSASRYAVESEGASGRRYRIESDLTGTPALFDVALFDVVDEQVSSRWIVKAGDLSLSLLPPSWAQDGFWEAFFDGNAAAVQRYREERDRLHMESEPIDVSSEIPTRVLSTQLE